MSYNKDPDISQAPPNSVLEEYLNNLEDVGFRWSYNALKGFVLYSKETGRWHETNCYLSWYSVFKDWAQENLR